MEKFFNFIFSIKNYKLVNNYKKQLETCNYNFEIVIQPALNIQNYIFKEKDFTNTHNFFKIGGDFLKILFTLY